MNQVPGNVAAMPQRNASAIDAREPDLQKVIDYFVAYRERSLEPPPGTVTAKLWREGKLTKRHCQAAEKFYEDLCSTFDGPQARTSDPSREPVQSNGLRVHTATPSGQARKRIEDLIRWLHVHEYRLLELVVRDYHTAVANHHSQTGGRDVFLDLATLGKGSSGYSGRAQSMAAGTARIQALLNTIAEFYKIPELSA